MRRAWRWVWDPPRWTLQRWAFEVYLALLIGALALLIGRGLAGLSRLVFGSA